MTEEQKQALIAKCRNEIKRYSHLIETFDPNEGDEMEEYEETIRGWGEVIAVNSLALTALTARPVKLPAPIGVFMFTSYVKKALDEAEIKYEVGGQWIS